MLYFAGFNLLTACWRSQRYVHRNLPWVATRRNCLCLGLWKSSPKKGKAGVAPPSGLLSIFPCSPISGIHGGLWLCLSGPGWGLLTPGSRAPPLAHRNIDTGILVSATAAAELLAPLSFQVTPPTGAGQDTRGLFFPRPPITPTRLSSKPSS
jgi:hypothetical protein